MEDWIIILLAISVIVILVIAILLINKHQKKSKLKKTQHVIIEKEYVERQRKQKLQAEIDAKVKNKYLYPQYIILYL